MQEWGDFFEKIENRVIKKETIGVEVSTVFIGIDHGFGGPPLWFETIIFGGHHDGYRERYATYEEAEAGHARAVKIVKNEQT